MDPMDYTMESPRSQTAAPGCPYMQNPALPPMPDYQPQYRDAHHYDPVHNTETWYPHPHPLNPNIPPSWAPGSGPNFPNFPTLGGGLQDMSDYRSPGSYMNMPPLSFRDQQYPYDSPFSSYRDRSNGNSPSVEHNAGRSSAPATATSAAPSSRGFPRLPPVSMQPFLAEYARRNRPTGAANLPNDHTTTSFLLDRSQREPQHPTASRADQPAPTTNRRSIRTLRGDSHMASRRRRMALGYLPDDALGSDEDDSSDEFDMDVYRTSQDWLLHSESDRERFLATARGRVATGKRVPSKEALASLEKVKPEDLTGNDRNCIICYNEMGVKNPEGVVEAALRLPRCKHVFGDKCIKKWFEDNDSCPYCRDKLPSEMTIIRSSALEALRMREQRLTAAQRARLQYISRLPSSDEAHHHSFLSEGRSESDTHPRASLSAHVPPPLVHSNSSPNRHMMESPESRRRRQRRPMEAANRSSVQNGRPASIGAARLSYPTMYQFSGPTATTPTGMPGGGPNSLLFRDYMPRRPPSPGHDSSSSEEASPAVAVGSSAPQSRALDPRMPHFSPQWPESLVSPFSDRSNQQPFRSGILPPLRTNHGGNSFDANHGTPASASSDHTRSPASGPRYDPQYDSHTMSFNRFRNSLYDDDSDSQPRWSR